MKKHYLSGLLLVACVSTLNAQFIPDPLNEPPSNSNYYYQNLGQIVDENGFTHQEVRYYTEKTFPAVYLSDDRVSFVGTQGGDTSVTPGALDTINRIDLQFICNPREAFESKNSLSMVAPCGEIQAYEPGADHLNYYLPHCPNGIENVPGYARIVYHNAFPDIDVHFYSNASAMKSYIVVNPGGNPGDILFAFSGQDSIGVLTNGSLAMYLRAWKLQFPQAIAYQLDASNNIIPLNWLPTWNHNGSGQVTISVGSFDPSKRLVIAIGGSVPKPTNIQNLEWSVYYGDDGYQNYPRLHVDDKNQLYHAMSEGSGIFPAQTGSTPIPSANNGGYDWYVSMFDPIGARLWATYYGGSTYDFPTAIDEFSNEVWVAGLTYSTNAPLGPETGLFKQTANAGLSSQTTCIDGLMACFDKTSGALKFGTYFGGGGQADDRINAMYIDRNFGKLYIVGTNEQATTFNNGCSAQTTGSFPLCSGTGSRFFQGSKAVSTDREGFIAEFELKDRKLVWSTLFGGQGADDIHTVVAYNDELYIGGKTNCGNVGFGPYPSPITTHSVFDFPLANPGGGAFFQTSIFNHTYPSNQFLSKFNADYQLEWSTFFGSSINGTRKIAFNPDGKLYAYFVGVRYQEAAPVSSAPNSLGKVPIFSSGTAYFESPSSPQQQAVIAGFDEDLSLKWSTYLHSYAGGYTPSPETFASGMDIDDSGRIFVGTFMNNEPAPTFNLAGAYWQSQNASTGLSDAQQSDNYIMGFNTGGEATWGTFFGGAYLTPQIGLNSRDGLADLATGGSDFLFITGWTECPESPYKECPPGAYCDMTYNPGFDCYISRFRITDYPVDPDPNGINETQAKQSSLTVYPNPADDLVMASFLNTDPQWQNAQIAVYDQAGRKINTASLKLRQGINRFKINMSGFSAGAYYLEISGKGATSSVKFIKK